MKLHPPTFPSTRLLLLLLLPLLIAPFFYLRPVSTLTHQSSASPATSTPPLTVLTLLFNQNDSVRDDTPTIEHNCLFIKPTPHRFLIYTENLDHGFCSVCTCILFKRRNCPCLEVGDDPCWGKRLCEKLYFIVDAINEHHEFLFLDADLMILKPSFLTHIAIRSQAHDFLASYGHAGIDEPRKYYRDFNTGLFFIRYLQGVRYERMIDEMMKHKVGHDQGVVSGFVQETYENWDVLSWKWHCRALEKRDIRVPPRDCYTLHDRSEREKILKELNLPMLSIGSGRVNASTWRWHLLDHWQHPLRQIADDKYWSKTHA